MRYNKGKRIIADGVMGMKKQTALMNHWQLCQYLRKLHLPQVVPPPDLATLKLLQDAHLKYVFLQKILQRCALT